MTRFSKKRFERIVVEEAANLLGKVWDLGKCREHPDFIVTEGQHQFGLEVRQIFRRLETSGGSAEKREESHRRKALANLRNRYEAINDIPLSVRFLGAMRDDLIGKVFDVLIKQDLSSKPPGYQLDFKLDDQLHVFVTRAFHPDWICVNDHVGWVNRKPKQILMDAIKKKSKHL